MISNEILENIKNRRSIRSFKAEQIKDEELEAILEASIYAATGHNDQPWHFTVIQNAEFIDYMSNKTKEEMKKSNISWIAKMGQSDRHIFYNTPTLIVVSGRQDSYSPLTDCSAAIQNMLLAAESLNIGSVWIGLIDFFFALEEEVKKLKLPQGYKPYYGVCLGYKASSKVPTAPERNKEVISYIK